jgi:hypothetical protein
MKLKEFNENVINGKLQVSKLKTKRDFKRAIAAGFKEDFFKYDMENIKYLINISNNIIGKKRDITTFLKLEDLNLIKAEIKRIQTLKKEKEQQELDEINKMQDDYYSAIMKNEALVGDLIDARTNFLGIGTNKTKRRLTKLSENDEIAKVVLIALYTEDANIMAKKYFGKYRNEQYNLKYNNILKLIDLFNNHTDWIYGIEKKNDYSTNAIIYFEIPGMEQISWHIYLSNDIINKLPTYPNKWDCKVNSTLYKLENKIKKDYNSIIY